MDRKWIFLGMVFLASLLIGGVSAADLASHDFDGHFSMDVPKDVNFTNKTIVPDEVGQPDLIAVYMGPTLEIMYLESPTPIENYSSYLYQPLFETVYPMELFFKGQEGNLSLFDAYDDGETTPVVATTSGNKMIFVIGDDLDLIKEMGHSIKFK